MTFLLDENMEYRVAVFLRDQGHDVTAVARDYPHALSDEQVLSISVQEGRILLTNDRDFGDMLVRHEREHCGVIYFRLPAATAELKIERLNTLLASHGDQLDQLLVVTEHRVRVARPRPR